MTRSVWKGPFVAHYLLKKIQNYNYDKPTIIKTYARSSTILDIFVGVIFSVYNGKKFITFKVTEDMVGHKLGEFSHTRIHTKHNREKKSVVHAKK